MKKLADYFDMAKKVTGSDRQTGLKIGMKSNHISMARHDGYMRSKFCVKLAEIIGVDPMEVKEQIIFDGWSRGFKAEQTVLELSQMGYEVEAEVVTAEFERHQDEMETYFMRND